MVKHMVKGNKQKLGKVAKFSDEDLFTFFKNDWAIGTNVNNKIASGKRSPKTSERVVVSF
jgi:hypothetical protein